MYPLIRLLIKDALHRMHLLWPHVLVTYALDPLSFFQVEEVEVAEGHLVFGCVAAMDEH